MQNDSGTFKSGAPDTALGEQHGEIRRQMVAWSSSDAFGRPSIMLLPRYCRKRDLLRSFLPAQLTGPEFEHGG